MNDDDFFSVNRLVEFGLGMAMAQQMVQVMNNAISEMNLPGTMNKSLSSISQYPYYAIVENKQLGPLSEHELHQLILNNKINKESYIWKIGMPKWEMVENLPEVLKLVALSPPPFNNKIYK